MKPTLSTIPTLLGNMILYKQNANTFYETVYNRISKARIFPAKNTFSNKRCELLFIVINKCKPMSNYKK